MSTFPNLFYFVNLTSSCSLIRLDIVLITSFQLSGSDCCLAFWLHHSNCLELTAGWPDAHHYTDIHQFETEWCLISDILLDRATIIILTHTVIGQFETEWYLIPCGTGQLDILWDRATIVILTHNHMPVWDRMVCDILWDRATIIIQTRMPVWDRMVCDILWDRATITILTSDSNASFKLRQNGI